MDTQAMTLGDEIIPSDIQAQRDRIPDAKPHQINLISDALKLELKQLINEVLDERNEKLHRDANDDSWLYRGTY